MIDQFLTSCLSVFISTDAILTIPSIYCHHILSAVMTSDVLFCLHTLKFNKYDLRNTEDNLFTSFRNVFE